VRKLILRMAITLDGVVAPENDKDVFDHSDEGVWSDTFAMLETVDTVLLGAGMHQEYLSYWQSALTSPTASQSERRYATMAARTPHFVLSRTLRKVEWPNATVLTGGVDGIADLKEASRPRRRPLGRADGRRCGHRGWRRRRVPLRHPPGHRGRRQEVVRQRRRDAPCAPSGHQDVSIRHRGRQIRPRLSS